jgi:hypothetical protein
MNNYSTTSCVSLDLVRLTVVVGLGIMDCVGIREKVAKIYAEVCVKCHLRRFMTHCWYPFSESMAFVSLHGKKKEMRKL